MEERKSVIYVHKNKINGKVYIGQTNDIKRRWCGNGTQYANSTKFWRAICKYGWNNFEHIILEENLTVEEANIKEAEYIKKYNSIENGYNTTLGGSNEKKPYLSKYLKEKWKDPEYREKKIASISGDKSHFYGSDKSGANNPMYGKHHSKETKEKISKKAKERFANNPDAHKGKNNGMSKQVICITTGEIFECQRDAAKWAGVGYSTMSRWLRKETKTTGKHPITGVPLQWDYFKEN